MFAQHWLGSRNLKPLGSAATRHWLDTEGHLRYTCTSSTAAAMDMTDSVTTNASCSRQEAGIPPWLGAYCCQKYPTFDNSVCVRIRRCAQLQDDGNGQATGAWAGGRRCKSCTRTHPVDTRLALEVPVHNSPL
jgi:hypothetical protein